MLPSNKFTLHARDFLKGLLMAFGTAFFTTLTASLVSGSMPNIVQIKFAAIAGVSAGIFYISKNFFTNDIPIAEKILEEAHQKKYEQTK